MNAIVPSLAWALLDFVWQGLLVGWAAALLLAVLRRARPQTRYGVVCAALLLCAALPLSGVVLRMQDGAALATAAPALLDTASPVLPVRLVGERVGAWQDQLQSRLPLVVLIWSCGAGALALRMVMGLLWVRRASATTATDPVWQGRLQHMASRLGIVRPVRLALADSVHSPVTAGWWRPVVLLPAALLSGMPPDLLEALLAHELAHIRRHDYLVNLIQTGIETLLFYHPTVWWLSNRIRVEREQIADDVAASMLGEPRRLALALSELEQFQFVTTPRLAHAAHGGHLMSRIKRLIRPDTEPLNWKMAVPLLGLCAAGAVFYAHADSSLPALAAAVVSDSGRVPTPPEPPAPPAPPTGLPHPAAPPAPPAPPPPPPAQFGKGSHYTFNQNRNGPAYALVRANGEQVTMSGRDKDLQLVSALQRKVGGEFLWFRNGANSYVVQDKATLERLQQAWSGVDKLSAQMDGLSKQMDGHSKVMDQLGADMDKASQALDEGGFHEVELAMNGIGRKQEAIGRKMEKAGRKIERANTGAERAAAQAEMAKLQAEMAQLQDQMAEQQKHMEAQQAKFEKSQEPLEAIGKQMADAGKPMEALGKQMEAVGKEMEKASKEADKVVRSLIQDALKNGLAKPAPATSASGG